MKRRDERRDSAIRELLDRVKVERPSEPPALPEPWPRDGRPSEPPSPWDAVVLENAS